MNEWRLLASTVGLLILIGCNSVPTNEKTAIPSEPAGKQMSEVTWEKDLKAARGEGRVVVYGGSAAAALKTYAVKPVKEEFGLDLEVLTAGASELIARMLTERNRGLFVPDVYISGSAEMYKDLKPTGAVDPLEAQLILPEVVDTRGWLDGKIPWGDADHKVLIYAGDPNPQIAINTDLVQKGEIGSFYDLLNPKWRERIVVNDPTVNSGTAFYTFNALLYNKMAEVDFLRQLVKQEPAITRDQQVQIEWLVRGKYPVALWPSTGRTAQYLKQGAPIVWQVTKEGVHVSGGGAAVTLMNKAPHPEAAKVLLNWLLGKEGQLLLQTATDKQSLRVDIPTDKLDPSRVRQPGTKYYADPNNLESFVLQDYDKNLQLAKDIFGPLLK